MIFAPETAAVPSGHPRNPPGDLTSDSENAVPHTEGYIPFKIIRPRTRDGWFSSHFISPVIYHRQYMLLWRGKLAIPPSVYAATISVERICGETV